MSAPSSDRAGWYARRRMLEHAARNERKRHSLAGIRQFSRYREDFGWTAGALRLLGLWNRGAANARGVRLAEIKMRPAGLPPAFEGFRILHLSDLHVDQVPGLMAEAARLLSGIEVDLLALTGDYQTLGRPHAARAAAEMAPLLGAVKAAEGAVAVLGNHDGAAMVGALEGCGVRVLVNETHAVERGGERLLLVGVDDVHTFHTPDSAAVLLAHRQGFRMALAHTPDLATLAAEAGYALYLCGHTHGGQICLPGGRPLMTGLDTHRRLAAGPWHWRGMAGHTSPGLGSGSPPIRYNCPPAATLLTLRGH